MTPLAAIGVVNVTPNWNRRQLLVVCQTCRDVIGRHNRNQYRNACAGAAFHMIREHHTLTTAGTRT